MADSKVFRLPEGIDATSVGKEVENLFKQKNQKDPAGNSLQE